MQGHKVALQEPHEQHQVHPISKLEREHQVRHCHIQAGHHLPCPPTPGLLVQAGTRRSAHSCLSNLGALNEQPKAQLRLY